MNKNRPHFLIATAKVFILISMILGTSSNVFASDNLFRVNEFGSAATAELTQANIQVPGQMNLQSAINTVTNGGVIEIGSGTYNAPSGGWRITDPGKHFTIRAAQGASVTLSGANSTDILRYGNSSISAAGSVAFERLTFSSGYTTTQDVAAGVTITQGVATFIGCNFLNNKAANGKTVGGAVYIRQNSIVFFIDSVFDSNTSTFGGAGIGARIHTKIYIHNSRFTNNRTNVSGHVQVAPGGGINAADSILRISNTSFSGNQVAGHGAGLYVLGSKNDAWRSDAIVTNSLFKDNQAIGDSSFQGEGGGINIEDNAIIRVYNSRFITNTANIGGGANNYRARMEIYNSSFLGNQAYDPGDALSGFGGAVSINSDDVNLGDSYAPKAELVVEDTYFQGRYGPIGSTAATGGCIHTKGNEFGMGTNYGSAQNYRADVTLRRDVFYDCDVSSTIKTVWGGALEIVLSNLQMVDSIVANSNVTNGDGGGLVIAVGSSAEVDRSYFVHNGASGCGGAIYLFGSYLNLHDSYLAQNSAKTGANFWDSCGGSLFTNMDSSRGLGASGTVHNNTFSQNVGMSIDDYDQGTPKNTVVYNSNKFYETTFSTRSNYWLSGPQYTVNLTAPQLNALVTGYGIDKSPMNNNSDGNSPYIIGAIRAAPTTVLSSGANGESGLTPAYISYAWSGASATYNGGAVSGYAGTASSTTARVSTLSVNGTSYSAIVGQGEAPSATIGIINLITNYTFSWNVNGGTFLDAAFDRNLSIPTAPSGSISTTTVPGTTYNFYAITKEGGVVVSGTAGNSTVILSHHTYVPKIVR